jgi:GAF domain
MWSHPADALVTVVTYYQRMVATEDGSRLAAVHERFLAAPGAPLPDLVRPVVAESWRRSLALGVDPCAGAAPLDLTDSELREYRDRHPLAPMMPLIRQLLTENADEAEHIVAVGDARGRLLWVEGHHRLRAHAESMWFVEGALWSEGGAGTNAPGTALALDAPVQIGAEEHFGLGVQAWSCVAAPVHDPLTGRLLGVIDLTGRRDVAGPRSLALVRACAVAVEAGLALQVGRDDQLHSAGAPRWASSGGAGGSLVTPGQRHGVLQLMGPEAGMLDLPERRVRLSRRHTEMVWLLSRARLGLSAQEIDAALHADGEHLITVRAEINRLRRVIGEELLLSRPYRLSIPVTTDVDEIRRNLSAGHLLEALDLFTGPVLPESQAPAVQGLASEIVGELRQAVLDSGSATALDQWTSRPAGHDDVQAWEALAALVSPASPRRARARSHVHRLETRDGLFR